jgi:hypothetical protein
MITSRSAPGEGDHVPDSPTTTLPASMAEAVRRVCERATRRNFGQAVYDTNLTQRGVEVRLSSWPRMREALHALTDRGWIAREDETFDMWQRHGAGLVVTGRAKRPKGRR